MNESSVLAKTGLTHAQLLRLGPRPHCGRKAGQGCKMPDGTTSGKTHDARLKAVLKMAEGQVYKMTWTHSARGAWVGHDGIRSYVISPIWCYEKDTNKQIRCWRMRIDGVQVGGADKTAIWTDLADAKDYAETMSLR